MIAFLGPFMLLLWVKQVTSKTDRDLRTTAVMEVGCCPNKHHKLFCLYMDKLWNSELQHTTICQQYCLGCLSNSVLFVLALYQHLISPLPSAFGATLLLPSQLNVCTHIYTRHYACTCTHRVSSSFVLLWYHQVCLVPCCHHSTKCGLHTKVTETVQFPELEPVSRD